MSIENINNIQRKPVNMAELQGSQITMKALLPDLKTWLEKLSKAINTNNLDTIYVVNNGKETPIKKYISDNIKISENIGKKNIDELNTAIKKTLKNTTLLHEMTAFAVDNNSKEKKGENRPEFLNKIKIDLEPSQKLSANIGVGPVPKPLMTDPNAGKIGGTNKPAPGGEIYVYASLNVESVKRLLLQIKDPNGNNTYKNILEA